MGTGTTAVAAGLWGRNSIGIEIDPEYYATGVQRIEKILHKNSAGVVVPHDITKRGEWCSISKKNLVQPSGTFGKSEEISKSSKVAKPEKKTRAIVQR
jgi:hypothetical protein